MKVISIGVISVIIFGIIPSIHLHPFLYGKELRRLREYLATHPNGDKKIRYSHKNNGAGFNGGGLEFSDGTEFIFPKDKSLLRANDLIEATDNFEISERRAI